MDSAISSGGKLDFFLFFTRKEPMLCNSVSDEASFSDGLIKLFQHLKRTNKIEKENEAFQKACHKDRKMKMEILGK